MPRKKIDNVEDALQQAEVAISRRLTTRNATEALMFLFRELLSKQGKAPSPANKSADDELRKQIESLQQQVNDLAAEVRSLNATDPFGDADAVEDPPAEEAPVEEDTEDVTEDNTDEPADADTEDDQTEL